MTDLKHIEEHIKFLCRDKQDCGPDIDRSCECHYQWSMDESAEGMRKLLAVVRAGQEVSHNFRIGWTPIYNYEAMKKLRKALDDLQAEVK